MLSPSRASVVGMSDADHGTRARYVAHRRAGETPCDECKAANAAAGKAEMDKRHDAMIAGKVKPKHGTASTYKNYKCRCLKCIAAHAKMGAGRRKVKT